VALVSDVDVSGGTEVIAVMYLQLIDLMNSKKFVKKWEYNIQIISWEVTEN
jgi:hypothetical protein